VREVLEVRFEDLPEGERRDVVRAERNRLRKDFAPDLARVELEQPEALGPEVAAHLRPTLLDRLQRHADRERFVEELRETAGAEGDDLNRVVRDLLAGKATAGAREAERDLAQRVREADRVAEHLGLACRLVPREVPAPPARLLAQSSQECSVRKLNRASSCDPCRLWRPCPAGARVLVARVVGDWVGRLGRESGRWHQESPGVLSPWMLVPGG
jgi:hypothetical protein